MAGEMPDCPAEERKVMVLVNIMSIWKNIP